MNLIEQNNSFFEIIDYDKRLNSTHISMYYTLMNYWNKSKFKQIFYIFRNDVMFKSRIGSTNTYYKCLRDLESWGYLKYFPAKNGRSFSYIQMTPLNSKFLNTLKEKDDVLNPTDSYLIQALQQLNAKSKQEPILSNIKNDTCTESHTKQYTILTKNIYKSKEEKNSPILNEVILFFISQNKSEQEALKFYYHYEAKQWKGIKNWNALAQKWLLQEFNLKNEPNSKVYINNTKDYGKPF
jgi:hypothetical protein